jgi:hypothetical protein
MNGVEHPMLCQPCHGPAPGPARGYCPGNAVDRARAAFPARDAIDVARVEDGKGGDFGPDGARPVSLEGQRKLRECGNSKKPSKMGIGWHRDPTRSKWRELRKSPGPDAVTHVAVLATANGTGRWTKEPTNQATSLTNRRQDSASKWSRKMSRISARVGG